MALKSITGKPASRPFSLADCQALLHAGHEFLGHVAADDLGLERIALAGLNRLEQDLHPRELARAAGLLLVRVVDLGLAPEGLAIGDLRRADVGVDLVGAAQDIDLDVQVQFAHALEDGLALLLVGGDAEGRILGASFCRATPSFSWSALDFGSMAISITGSGKSILSRIIGDFTGSHRVSPVRVSLRPASATMSPAKASLMSSRLLECMSSMRPTRSLRSREELSSAMPLSSLPE